MPLGEGGKDGSFLRDSILNPTCAVSSKESNGLLERESMRSEGSTAGMSTSSSWVKSTTGARFFFDEAGAGTSFLVLVNCQRPERQ